LVCSHPGLDPGSGSNKEQRRTGLLDGGPLTDNVVFVSVQRLLAREAELASPKAGLATEGDWLLFLHFS